MTNATEAELLPVTPEDREAYLAFNMLPPEGAEAVRAGKWDHTTGMQVLARHRLAHTAPEPVLRWEGDQLRLGEEAVASCGLIGGTWRWRCHITGKSDWADDRAEARAAAEKAVRDWLARAGLYTGPNDCGVDHPNAAWSEAEPEQQSVLGNASVSSDGCGGSTPPPVATHRAGLGGVAGEPVATYWERPGQDREEPRFTPNDASSREVYLASGYVERFLYTHPPASPSAEVVERIEQLDLLHETNLPNGEWDLRTFRATLALCQRHLRAALAKVQKP